MADSPKQPIIADPLKQAGIETNSADNPAVAKADSRLIELIKQLAFSFFSVSLGFVLVTALLLWHFAGIVDQSKIDQSIHSTVSQMHNIGDDLAVHSKDFGWWQATIDNVVLQQNETFLQENYRGYLVTSFSVHEVLVLDEQRRPVYAERLGQQAVSDNALNFDKLLLTELVDAAQDTPMAEPQPVFRYIERDGELYWIAACAISTEQQARVLPEGTPRPTLIFTRHFYSAKDEIETELGFQQLNWSLSRPLDTGSVVSIPIKAYNGSVLGYVSWGLQLPGVGMLQESIKWASPLLIFCVLLGWFIHKRIKQTFAKIESIGLEAEVVKSSQAFFQAMADDAPVLIWETDLDGKLIYSNKRFNDLLGLSVNSETALHLQDLVEAKDREIMAAFFENCQVNQEPKDHEFRATDVDGNSHWLNVVCAPQQDNGDAPRFIFSANDITERKAIEQEAWQQANYDNLTQLPNRSLFQNRLNQGIKSAQRNSTSCALMFIDLDNFKNINDSQGHGAGDIVLQEAAKRISESIRDTDTAARMGGDEFVLLLLAEYGSPVFDQVARRVLEALAKPFELGHSEVFLSGSIGIATYPADGHSAEVLMMNADTAMYHAKRSGRNQISYYAPEMNAQLKASMQMEQELRLAIERKELFLVFQPIMSLQDNTMVGAESLVRWRKPDGGLVFPDQFIYVAEQAGLIAPLGDYVLEESCAQLQTWQQQGMELSISVNVSPIQLREESFAARVEQLLKQYQIKPEKLQLELTEQIFIEDTDDMVRCLDQLAQLGVVLAIDDFGTGYSSLSYLQKLSVNVLKIDRSFMDRIPSGVEAVKLVRAIIAMAHSLNLKVVAEGIELKEQHDFLRAEGCDCSQGYYYSRPVEAEQLCDKFAKGCALG